MIFDVFVDVIMMNNMENLGVGFGLDYYNFEVVLINRFGIREKLFLLLEELILEDLFLFCDELGL